MFFQRVHGILSDDSVQALVTPPRLSVPVCVLWAVWGYRSTHSVSMASHKCRLSPSVCSLLLMRFQNLKFLFLHKELRRRQKRRPIVYIYIGFNFSCCVETFWNIFLNLPISFDVTMPDWLSQGQEEYSRKPWLPGQLALKELNTEMNENYTKMSKFNMMHSQLNYALAQHQKISTAIPVPPRGEEVMEGKEIGKRQQMPPFMQQC